MSDPIKVQEMKNLFKIYQRKCKYYGKDEIFKSH